MLNTSSPATQSGLFWHSTRNGMLFTSPRMFTIERLPNGYHRLYHYGPNMATLHTSLLAAYREAREAYARRRP